MCTQGFKSLVYHKHIFRYEMYQLDIAKVKTLICNILLYYYYPIVVNQQKCFTKLQSTIIPMPTITKPDLSGYLYYHSVA